MNPWLKAANGIVPILAVIAFFILNAAGVGNAWLVFMVVPIWYIAAGAFTASKKTPPRDE